MKDLPAGVEVKDICIGAGGLGLDCHCGPLGQSVANDSPLRLRFFEAVLFEL